ncbi:hypothetical protein F383_12088 [Gossypium arboreum]|uniref:Uncharacterized protein n=1 Tax=Gossypium arboreum TaxID=29729 RepID=A0A0B0PXU1_GOSAR|nr:hypothetical protein F383_12088 [Gossypium arboreum]
MKPIYRTYPRGRYSNIGKVRSYISEVVVE